MRTGARVAVIAGLLAACHGGRPDTPDATPSPSPSPTSVPGGTLQGNYLLRIEPSAGCAAPGTVFTFPVQATAADTPRAQGFSMIVPDTGRVTDFEIELRYMGTDVRGAIGTTASGEPSREGIRLWIRAIASGPVTTVGRPPGQVLQGGLSGYLAFGRDRDPEGALGSCTSEGHHFRLTLS
jgi:hypothetical protein